MSLLSNANDQIGYLSRYAPRLREYGGIFFHTSCWAVLAERALDGMDATYDLWRRMPPILRGMHTEDYQAEPYATTGNVGGPLSPYPGWAGLI